MAVSEYNSYPKILTTSIPNIPLGPPVTSNTLFFNTCSKIILNPIVATNK